MHDHVTAQITKKKKVKGLVQNYFLQRWQELNTEKQSIKRFPENYVLLELGRITYNNLINAEARAVNGRIIQFPSKQTGDDAVVCWLATLGMWVYRVRGRLNILHIYNCS